MKILTHLQSHLDLFFEWWRYVLGHHVLRNISGLKVSEAGVFNRNSFLTQRFSQQYFGKAAGRRHDILVENRRLAEWKAAHDVDVLRAVSVGLSGKKSNVRL